MPDWIVPLSDVRYSEAEVETVAGAYRSGWLSQGPMVAAFERAFAAALGAEHAIAVASGTAALQLICAGLGLGQGDEVVVPSLTFAASAAAVVHAGARPVFAEIRSEHEPWLSTDAVAAAITQRTRAIITVGYGGHPGEARQLGELAADRGLDLIEDAAHALGARDRGRAAGTFGRAAAFSFFANKNLPLGEGGMVLSADPELVDRMRRLRSHGLSADTWSRHRGRAAGYEVLEPGFNFRLDEPRSALGLALLGRLGADNERRAALAERYGAALAGLDDVAPAITPADGITNAWHIYPVLVEARRDRDAIRAQLGRAGVQTSVHYPPLHRTRAFAGPASLPLTESFAARTLTLPLFPHLSEFQHDAVLSALATALTA